MSINATTFLAALPGKRVSVTSNGVTVASVLRSGRVGNGTMADTGMYTEPQATIYPLSGAFGKEIVLGDLFSVGGTYGICFSVDHINEDTIDRIMLLLLYDTVEINRLSFACHSKASQSSADFVFGGSIENNERIIITHNTLVDSGNAQLKTGDDVVFSDTTESTINSISKDCSGNILTIKCTRKGKVKNG